MVQSGSRGRPQRPPVAFRVYTALLAAGVAVLLPQGLAVAADRPLTTLGWILLTSVASTLTVQVLPRQQVEASVRAPVSVAAAVVLPPPLTLVVNVAALVSARELRSRPDGWKVLFNHAQHGLAAWLAALAAQEQPFGILAGTLVALVVFEAVNDVAVALSVTLRGRLQLRDATQRTAAPFPRFATSFGFVALLSLLIVVLYDQVHPWAVALLGLPLWLGFSALASAKEASDRADELAARVRELEALNALGTALLASRDAREVAGVATAALRSICAGHPGGDRAAVLTGGRPPADLDARPVSGTDAIVVLPHGLDDRRAAEVGTVCAAVGLALTRLAAERHLGEAQRAQVALAGKILEEGTIERSRIALNVHDDVLPYLAAAQIQADNVLTAAARGDMAVLLTLAAKVRDGIEDGIRTLRGVLDDLQRQTLEPGNLVPWLGHVAERTRFEHGISLELDTSAYRGGLPHATEILLAETVAGCLANVVKHAGATRAAVRVATEPGGVGLEVADDGRGFDPAQVGDGHHGLALMRQRVALVSGHFVVDSAPGRGTVVRLGVPVEPAPADRRLPAPPPRPVIGTGSAR